MRLVLELLDFVGTGRCVGWVFGADVDVAIRENADVQRDDRHVLFVDRLGFLAEVARLNSFARKWWYVCVEECGAPPLALSILEWRSVTEEAAGEFTGTIRAGDLVGDTVVQVVRAFAALICRLSRAEVDVLVANVGDKQEENDGNQRMRCFHSVAFLK